jgi:DNA-binding SARP family transcriptional activator
LRVRLLGSIDVLVDGTFRPVRGQRSTAVLAMLALQPGEIVSTDRLIEIVWGDHPPSSPEATLQSQVSRLRDTLGDRTAIRACSRGYVLDLGDEATDVQSAERLIRHAADSGDLRERESGLRDAITLYRGRPLADLTGTAWFGEQADRLDQMLMQARRGLIETRLALGEHLQLVGELETLSREHPLDEQIHWQLMLALYRAGRQSEALAVYRRLRRTLDDELGIAPSRPLRDLETAILRHDASLGTPPSRAAAPPARVPAQLPLPIDGFTGRVREIKDLDSLLPDPDDIGPSVGMPVAALSGTAGVGKTTLAVHWAHRIAARFHDGQLYVNLRSFGPTESQVDPANAVRGFLDALGVPSERIPTDLDARVGLYRSLLAGKRILVVLDNARDADQIRPLLPGAPGCLAVVTSRHQLTGLAAIEGARAQPGPAVQGGGARPAGAPPGIRPGGRRVRRGGRDHRPVRPAPPGPGHRRRPRRRQPRLSAGHLRPRTARRGRRPGRAPRW